MEQHLPPRVIRPVSRRFASIAVLHGPATARDVAHWISVVASHDAVELTQAEHERLLEHPDIYKRLSGKVREWCPVHVHVGTMLAEVGATRIAHMKAVHGRLAASEISLPTRERVKGRRERHKLWHSWADEDCLTPPERSADVVRCLVGARLLHAAHPMEDRREEPVMVDVAAMRAFHSRHSAILYLRALAWMGGTCQRSESYRRFKGGAALAFRPRYAADALGMDIDAVNTPALLDRLVLEPAVEDLATAGIDMRFEWIRPPGRSRIASALEVSVAPGQRRAHARRWGRPQAA